MANFQCFECLFLDVGQGSSNVIYLGDGKAIVIDCGPGNSKEVLSFLKRYVTSIRALILSHNDSDHVNGVAGILAEYKGMVDYIYFLDDGKYEKIIGVLESWDEQFRPIPLRAESGIDGRGVVFDEDGIKLEIIFPDLIGNLTAQKAGNRRANQTSAILLLTFGKKRIVYSGDATIEAWEHLSNHYLAEKPFRCDIMTIPHHGGKITSGQDELMKQKKLYSEIIKPQYGIISVGSANKHKHPCPDAISALTESGIEILCTQITPRCCSDLEEIRGVNRIIAQPSCSSRNKQVTCSGKSKNVACIGTIAVEVGSEKVFIRQLKTHQQNKELFSKLPSFASLCD